jgi:hypothetical protein
MSYWTDIARHAAIAVGVTFVFAAFVFIVVRLLVMDL